VRTWPVYDENREPRLYQQLRAALATVFFTAGFISLFVSPMSWPLLAVYAGLGLLAAVVGRLGPVGGFVALAVLLFGVPATTNSLSGLVPRWYSAWWQPMLITVAAMGSVEFMTMAYRYLRRHRESDSGSRH
jgi:hypothetical protein